MFVKTCSCNKLKERDLIVGLNILLGSFITTYSG